MSVGRKQRAANALGRPIVDGADARREGASTTTKGRSYEEITRLHRGDGGLPENPNCSHESGSLPGTCTASVVVSKK
jgi:hypothetical protein